MYVHRHVMLVRVVTAAHPIPSTPPPTHTPPTHTHAQGYTAPPYGSGAPILGFGGWSADAPWRSEVMHACMPCMCAMHVCMYACMCAHVCMLCAHDVCMCVCMYTGGGWSPDAPLRSEMQRPRHSPTRPSARKVLRPLSLTGRLTHGPTRP